MGKVQKLAAVVKEGMENPQKIKKGLKVLKNQGPEIFRQRLSASVNYEPSYGRVKKEKLKNLLKVVTLEKMLSWVSVLRISRMRRFM